MYAKYFKLFVLNILRKYYVSVEQGGNHGAVLYVTEMPTAHPHIAENVFRESQI